MWRIIQLGVFATTLWWLQTHAPYWAWPHLNTFAANIWVALGAAFLVTAIPFAIRVESERLARLLRRWREHRQRRHGLKKLPQRVARGTARRIDHELRTRQLPTKPMLHGRQIGGPR
jgi:hypothetical protein